MGEVLSIEDQQVFDPLAIMRAGAEIAHDYAIHAGRRRIDGLTSNHMPHILRYLEAHKGQFIPSRPEMSLVGNQRVDDIALQVEAVPESDRTHDDGTPYFFVKSTRNFDAPEDALPSERPKTSDRLKKVAVWGGAITLSIGYNTGLIYLHLNGHSELATNIMVTGMAGAAGYAFYAANDLYNSVKK